MLYAKLENIVGNLIVGFLLLVYSKFILNNLGAFLLISIGYRIVSIYEVAILLELNFFDVSINIDVLYRINITN